MTVDLLWRQPWRSLFSTWVCMTADYFGDKPPDLCIILVSIYDCRLILKTTLEIFVSHLCLCDFTPTLKTTLEIFVSHLCLCDFTPTLKTTLEIFVSYLCLCNSAPTSKTALTIVVSYLCLCDCTPTLKTFLKMFISYFVHQPTRSLFHTSLLVSVWLQTYFENSPQDLCFGLVSVWLHTYSEDFSQDVYFVLCPYDCRPTLKTTLEISRCSVTTKLWAQPGCQRHWKMSQTMQVGWSVGWVHVCVGGWGSTVFVCVWYVCMCLCVPVLCVGVVSCMFVWVWLWVWVDLSV